MQKLFEQVLLLLEKGEKVSLSTVIARKGSVPAPVGSRLIVTADGSFWGTVGGGLLEAEVLRVAAKALKDEKPAITSLEFEAKEAAEKGMLCGGSVRLFTEVVFPTEKERQSFGTLVAELKASRPVALATEVVTAYSETPPKSARLLFRDKMILAGSLELHEWHEKIISAARGILEREEPLYLNLEKKLEDKPGVDGFLVEALYPDPTLVIFGAGHVARPLCKIAAMADFRVVVVDDRADFASREHFPESSEIFLCSPTEAMNRIKPGPMHYLVSVTRGHLQDREVVEQALKYPAAYLGMIGSKRKVKLLWEDLRAGGVEPEALEWVNAPIGLEIGAETPAEIAVSIVAEMIQTHRAKGRPGITQRTILL
jgi:xanthine dehydrogenase accessory factor